MLHLIYGLPGTGKTTHLTEQIKKDIACGQKALFIVPEQQTVEVERAMASLLPPSSQLIFEVVNFTRLANKLFRIYGGLSYHYITAGMKELFMWQAMKALAPFLREFGEKSRKDPSMPATLLAAISEFKAYDVTPAKLEQISEALEEGAFKNKLHDLSLIYTMYEGMIRESYDDSSDDLGKLAELLETRNFFRGYHVYIDSFTDFTAQEYRVLKCILAQADEVYLSLSTSSPSANELFLSSVNETSTRLRALVGEDVETVILSDFHRFSSPELKQIARDLWHFHVKGEKMEAEPTECNALSLMRCSDAYSEAKAATAQILSLVQEHGYRYRDIAVVARNAESYRGILDSELEKAGVPFFMSEKTDITTKPLVSMIFSVLAIKLKNYRSEDVITYAKTGLAGFTPYEIDILATYVNTWRIRGKQFLDGEWTMNPDGFTETVSTRGKAILETANAVRERLVGSLEPFFDELDRAKCASDFCNALYRFLKNSGVSESLKQYANRALDEGDKKEAAETASIFKAVFRVLSDITAAMGKEEMDLEDFTSALHIVLGKTEIGTIPTAADEVIVGSASTLRATGVRCAILLGLCEGEFPMRVSEKGLFTDKDRSVLEDFGVTLSGQSTKDAANELLYVYRAMTLPSEKLVLFYREKQISGGGQAPSLAFRRVAELFPNLKTVSFDSLSPSATIFDKSSAFEAVASLKNTPYEPSIRELLASDPAYQARMGILDASVTKAACRLEEGTTDRLFGDRLTLTQSQIEKYVSCHFSYYCRYVLKLRDAKRASFDYSNIGTFIHKVLEIFLKETGKDTIDADRDVDKIRQIIHREIEEQKHLFIPKSKESEGRILHLLLRFYRLASLVAVNLCREQKYSQFVSKLYEAEFGKNSKLGLMPPELMLSDGTTVGFSGKVDRVDTYRQGGKMYIRVVDYKTGAKAFSLDDIKEGYSLQLLLYLFAICDTKSEHFRRLIGCEEGDVLTPAGALYISMAIPRLKREVGDSDSDALEAASQEIKRSGLLLNDPETLHAMSSRMDPNVLAGVRVNARDGSLKGSALTDESTFALLKEELGQTVCRIAEEIRSGNANAYPSKHGGVLACAYCEMKPFCRVDRMKASEKKEKENET